MPTPHSLDAAASPLSMHGLAVAVDREALAALCQAQGIVRLSLFGSALRADFDPARSDIELLLEFDQGRLETSGWDFFDLPRQLAELFGHPVDLRTPRALSRYSRDLVLAEALPLYEQV